VFVANAKKGDKCKIKITEVARRFAIGEKVGEAEVAEEPEKVEEKEKKEEKPEKKVKKPKEEKKVEDK